MKISCTMIVRDEASTLRACLESIKPHVDELVIVDTGSTDSTPEIAREFADRFEVWTGCNDSEGRIADFSAARNYALELATGDAVCWFDGDDVVRGAENLRRLAQESSGEAWAWLAPYEYERDAQGRVVTLQWRERLVYPRTGWEWRSPVHEGLLGKAGTSPAYQQTDALVVEHQLHRSSKPRDPQRNLRILEGHVRKVGETDARSLHYLGAELMFNGRVGEACYWFRRHTQLSGWSDERCLSLLHLARITLAMGDWQASIDWALQAVATKSWPEPYWLMGQACCMMAEAGIEPEYNYRRGAHMLQQGFACDKPELGGSLLMKDPTARIEAHRWLAPALAKLGRVDQAIESAQTGLAGNAKAEELRHLLGLLKREKVLAQVAELDQLGALPQHAGVVIAATLKGEFKVERERSKVERHTREYSPGDREWREVKNAHPLFLGDRSVRLRIAFYLGHQLEPWTPETLEANGMGGSETMAWEMSKRLAKLGHAVTVFGHCSMLSKVQVFDGVAWTDSSRFPSDVPYDVLIVSRQHWAVELPHIAKTRVLWVHDVHVGPEFTPAIAAKYDLVWCLSNWHREFFLQTYPWLPPGKVEVTRNGIDPARFGRTDVPRNPHRAIYSSSPDRGLEEAVKAWPAVRKAVPDAELHVYYGFENWERSLELNGDNGHPNCSRAALTRLKGLVAETPGIVMHGRVNQRELADAMLGAGVWFYPTWFSETSCITAMEAQAAGLWCVCPYRAALAETVPDSARCWDVEGDPVKAVLWAIRLARKSTVHEPCNVSLDALAADWDKRLRKLVDDVVPAFSEAAQ